MIAGVDRGGADSALPRNVRKAVKRSERAGVDWFVWRPATSEHIADGYSDIKRHWTMRDLAHAHRVLDVYDETDKAQKRQI